MRTTIRATVLLFVLPTVLSITTLAVPPPTLVNYQGVLRDSGDAPLDGTYDMVFTFYSEANAGDQILIDRHTVNFSQPVTVTGGLFNVVLGDGDLVDGSGPGVFTTLAGVFRYYTDVWIQVEIGAETLWPRVRVVSAAYALNAGHLDGFQSSHFIDTSSTEQTKTGPLRVSNEVADPAVVGVVVGEPGVVLGGSLADVERADPELTLRLRQARAEGDDAEVAGLSSLLRARFRETHAPVATSGIVDCRVDAGYGAIEIGDLLVTSPTPGHAMRTGDPAAGTVLGKALEPLDAGSGRIRILVMPR